MKQAGLILRGKKSLWEMMKNKESGQGTGKPDGGSDEIFGGMSRLAFVRIEELQ